MDRVEQLYSDENWNDLNTVLVFKNKNFQFNSRVVIIELDRCLVKSMSQAKLYNTMNKHQLEIYEKDLIKKLQVIGLDQSIVILSNQVNRTQLNMDMVKQKIEMISKNLKIPIIGFFALKPNCFMKPHTGMWKLLNAYYKKYGNTTIQKAVVVSNEGGLILEKKTKKVVSRTMLFTDVDRSFAYNIGMPFKSIDEYLDDCQPLDYVWNKNIIPPDTRIMYVEQICKRKNVDIFQILKTFTTSETFVIMIMGAPRCGKTRLANEIVRKWENCDFGEMNAIKILDVGKRTKTGRTKEFKTLINSRISVVLDGGCHTEQLRKQFIKAVSDRNIPILLIEVYCGIEMCKVFNHAHVENSHDVETMLYKTQEYAIYKSKRKIINETDMIKYIMYTPQIDTNDAVMKYRY